MRPHGGAGGDKGTLRTPVAVDAVASVTVKDRVPSAPPPAEAAAAATAAAAAASKDGVPSGPTAAAAVSGGLPFAAKLGGLPPRASVSQRTQYIVVSHKPQVFERAQCLVGVYSHRRTSLAATAYFDAPSAGEEGGEAHQPRRHRLL